MGQKGTPEFFSLSPSDSARFAALAEGLQVSVVALSEVRASEKARIDSGYFRKQAVALAAQIGAVQNASLASISKTFRKGIFDIKADTYVEEGGVPFVRVGDLRSGLIDPSGLALISVEAHVREHKTALKQNDIVLSKTAYPAAALVTMPECNVSQDTIAVSLSEVGRRRFEPGYVISYLNSDIGRILMGRLFQGNVQEHLSLSEAGDLLIPELSVGLQSKVSQLVLQAEKARAASDFALVGAETRLLDSLGLHDWSPPEPLNYARSASMVRAAGRLDAQYYAPKHDDVLARLSATGRAVRIGDEKEAFVGRGTQPAYGDNGFPVINSRHVRTNRVVLDGSNRLAIAARLRIRAGDVLVNGTGVGTIGRAAPYLFEAEAIPDNHVTIVRLQQIDPVFLSVFLNSPIGAISVRAHDLRLFRTGRALPRRYSPNHDLECARRGADNDPEGCRRRLRSRSKIERAAYHGEARRRDRDPTGGGRRVGVHR